MPQMVLEAARRVDGATDNGVVIKGSCIALVRGQKSRLGNGNLCSLGASFEAMSRRLWAPCMRQFHK